MCRYRGFNRAGKRMERSATILGKHLDGSVSGAARQCRLVV